MFLKKNIGRPNWFQQGRAAGIASFEWPQRPLQSGAQLCDGKPFRTVLSFIPA